MQLNDFSEISLILPTISINNYIMDAILPKCNIIYGKAFSSVYFQILLYTNHDKNAKDWQKNKCWLSNAKLAKNINCNEKTVVKMISHMITLGLVKTFTHGKLRLLEVNYLNIKKFKSIDKINKNITNQLTSYAKTHFKNSNTYINKLQAIDEYYLKHPNNIYQFKDLNKLRQLIIHSEKIQHGSTLLFTTFFAKNIINLHIADLDYISEKDIAFKLGMSQSTISRYLNQFKKYNFLDLLKENKINNIQICEEMLEMGDDIKDTVIRCPICNKVMDSDKKLNAHISHCKDTIHVTFKNMLVENNAKTLDEINQVYLSNKWQIDEMIATNKKEVAKEKKEQEKLLKQQQKEKEKALRKQQREEERALKKKQRGEEKKKEEEERRARNKEANSQALKLIKYYYDLIDGRCPNFAKEINILRPHLQNGLTVDEILIIFKYMAKKGYTNLNFFNSSINDALTLYKCKKEYHIGGSDSNLIGLYYSGTRQRLTDRLMIQGIRKIKELRLNNYSTAEIKTIIDYMIEVKCPNFNFIVTIAPEALLKSEEKEKMTKIYSIDEAVNLILDYGTLEYGMILLQGNEYDVAKRKVMLKLKDDLCEGNVKLTKVNNTYSKFAIQLAKEIEKRHIYNSKFSKNQWIENIELNKVQN